jgi:hypothetical protein
MQASSASLDTDPNNCGTCRNNCTAAANVASATCAMGASSITSCEPGFTDCDRLATNGCEIPYTACPCSPALPVDNPLKRRCAEICAKRKGKFTCNDEYCVCVTPCSGTLADCDSDGSCEVSVLHCRTEHCKRSRFGLYSTLVADALAVTCCAHLK